MPFSMLMCDHGMGCPVEPGNDEAKELSSYGLQPKSR
jgi:hypothetical protein